MCLLSTLFTLKGMVFLQKKTSQKHLSSVSCAVGVFVPDRSTDILARVHLGLNSGKATGEQAVHLTGILYLQGRLCC